MRTCKSCDTRQEMENYAINKPSVGGRLLVCKRCYNEKRKQKMTDPEFRRSVNDKVRLRYATDPQFAERAKSHAGKVYRDPVRREAAHEKAREKRATDRGLQLERVRTRRYKLRNIEKVRASDRRYLGALRHAKTEWEPEFDQLVLTEAAELAVSRERATGIRWHVDHIEPLRSEEICGLHNPYNLAVVPAIFNLKKGNRRDFPRWLDWCQ